ncbi:MAG: tRNA (adenosine(37)-N6)-dimethylallyltransferase MiaA [Oscillospiraceae bacterium]|nr:tRNA (adenosine(37)-N6)-dimethylallyltransferase MiaA [Oscillospiraceae bacterium]
MDEKRKKLLVIAGPTASGKTALGIALAQRLNGEIVSADSMQVYRGMDIGTAKASPFEQRQVPHHMLDLVDPGENYSVSRYAEEAGQVCRRLFAQGKQPIVVGGTGLYIDALLAGRRFAGTEAEDGTCREELARDFDRLGGEEMLARLAEVDPERAGKLAPTDRRRIIRALEIYRLTGRTQTLHDEESRKQPPAFQALYTVLCFEDRGKLYERIEQRVDRMCREGLFEETARLLDRGISPDSTCMQAIGYRQAAWALRGEIPRDEAVALIKQATRRYAKRQLTWFRRHEEALWLYADRLTTDEMAERVRECFSEKGDGYDAGGD